MCFLSKKKIAILVISRTKSKRLKNKAKLKIKGINLIEIILQRLLGRFDRKNIIICSSNFNNDKSFYKRISQKYSVGIFFGAENNVLKRIIDCLEKNNFKHFIRITGDNPLVDINAIHSLSLKHIMNKSDYTFTDSLPMGMKPEIFSLKALKKNYKKNAISWTFKEATELYHKAYMDRKVRPNETHKHYLDRIMAMEIPYRLQHIKQFKKNTLLANVRLDDITLQDLESIKTD